MPFGYPLDVFIGQYQDIPRTSRVHPIDIHTFESTFSKVTFYEDMPRMSSGYPLAVPPTRTIKGGLEDILWMTCVCWDNSMCATCFLGSCFLPLPLNAKASSAIKHSLLKKLPCI